jgi:hypothetical protein
VATNGRLPPNVRAERAAQQRPALAVLYRSPQRPRSAAPSAAREAAELCSGEMAVGSSALLGDHEG